MSGPLKGIRVVDITTNISGPSLTMILGDLGADIIKIERPDIGDDSRRMGPLWNGEGAYYLSINRNKRSVVVNLQEEEGKKLVQDLVKDADVFVENFRYGKAAELGFGYEQLKEVNPELVYCSLTAYGQSGDRMHKPGYDAIIQADTGIVSINGTADGGLSRAAVSINDQGSAMWGAIGIISALYHRSLTGVGQKVETSLYETGVFWTGYHMLSYMATGEEPRPFGTNHASFAPYGAFHTKEQQIMIGVSNDSLFSRLCHAIDREEWITDDRFKTNIERVQNRNELNSCLEEAFSTKTAIEWNEILEEKGVPCAIVKNISDVIDDSQTKSTEMLTSINHPKIDNLRIPRLPVQLSETKVTIDKHPPLFGEHTKEVLKESGLSDETINDLINNKVIQVDS